MPTQQPKQQLTLVELLVIVAIVAILAAILLPALQQSKRRSASSTTASRQRPSEGQFNTIEPPGAARETPPPSTSAPRARSGLVFQLLLAGIIIKIIRDLRARKARPLLRKPEHRHPPDVED